MNPLNYATLEASKRLAAAGIVLETECIWYRRADTGTIELCLRSAKPVNFIVPAPSMAEVWRELPDSIGKDRITYNKTLKGFGVVEIATYESLESHTLKQFPNINPTDALIDLLIWVTEQKRKEKV